MSDNLHDHRVPDRNPTESTETPLSLRDQINDASILDPAQPSELDFNPH